MEGKKAIVFGVIILMFGALIAFRHQIPEEIVFGDTSVSMNLIGQGVLILGAICVACSRQFLLFLQGFWGKLAKLSSFLDFLNTGKK